MTTAHNYSEEGIYDLREALYLMSQNPPYKFVRLETIQMPKGTTPVFRMVFEGENITQACLQYLQGEHGPIDFENLKVLAAKMDSYIKSQEDYSI